MVIESQKKTEVLLIYERDRESERVRGSERVREKRNLNSGLNSSLGLGVGNVSEMSTSLAMG